MVIDNVGAPRLLFKSVAARSRGTLRSESQIRNDIANLEPLRWLLKSQFDRNVVVNFEIQELMFDSATSELAVEHPIVFTEAPCNRLHSRQMMSVLTLHRCPHVSYGVDSLYSLYYNNNLCNFTPGIVLSSSYHCTHILPVINGSQAASYLQRLFQLKYTGHSTLSTDYHQELEKWRSAEFYEQEVHRMQLPFSAKVLGSVVIVEEMQERRAQQLHRLQEINARRREEMLQQDQERLDKLLAPQEMLEDGYLEQFHKNLVQLIMDSCSAEPGGGSGQAATLTGDDGVAACGGFLALEHIPGGEGWIIRQDYEEKGGEYLSEHCASNIFILMKIANPVPRPAETLLVPVTTTTAASTASV
uniref:Actin related protein 5 n=1 Tax=Hucho hucho TaxID=62062 RepID=A0A4W5M0S7_9TELE